jgi:hypothetical protein
MKKQIVLLLLLLVIERQTWSQVAVPFTSELWKFETKDYRLEEYLGKQSIWIKENNATLPSVTFENGIIEYDLAFPQARCFIGVMFRMQDDNNFEEFYLRPHQSGNPDANQYTPVYNEVAGWQLYYGEGYGAPIPYTFNTWMHIKLLISGNFMEVYLNDMNAPVLFSELKRPVGKGYLGLRSFLGENHFANFAYTPMEKVALKGTPKPKSPPAQGTITQWQVSTPMPEKSLEKITSLESFKKTGPSWKTAATEDTGTLNLASVVSYSRENNTVFARIIVTSEKDQVKKLSFGFSDRVRVYLNDTLLFYGEDNYRSRDYRFLGTIGYFDAVYLNLKKGSNELIMAVSETQGGWGVKAKFEDVEGIKF